MADNKKRHVVSYEKMPLNPELAAAFAEKYPRGFSDYLTDLVKYPKPDGTSFYAVTVEIPDAIYLVKINVKTDDLEDVERWLEGEEDAENEAVAGGSADASDAKPCPTTTSPSTAADPTTNKPWKTRLSNTSGAR